MLVTPDGQWVAADSPEFLEALGDPNPDYDGVAFAVKNLGFVKFQVVEHSIIEIELYPRNVALPALLAIQQEILRSELKLFRVKFFDAQWHSEISSSNEQVISRLSELCAPLFTPPETQRFVIEPRDNASSIRHNQFLPALSWATRQTNTRTIQYLAYRCACADRCFELDLEGDVIVHVGGLARADLRFRWFNSGLFRRR